MILARLRTWLILAEGVRDTRMLAPPWDMPK